MITVQCFERLSAILRENKSLFLHICNPTLEFLFTREKARQMIKSHKYWVFIDQPHPMRLYLDGV